MASSSSQRGAARAQPPPDQLAAFYKLVDKQVIAGVLGRHARYVELSVSAAVQAEAFFWEDSLVVAHLQMHESEALSHLAQETIGIDQEALLRRSLAVLLSVIILMLRRIEANTLLPGTIREEEQVYFVHAQAALRKAQNLPVSSPKELRSFAQTTGYVTLLHVIFRSLDVLRGPYWLDEQKRMVESFVLQGLDIIPRTAGIHASLIAGEASLVAIVEKGMNPRRYDPTFCAAVLRKWRSDAVSSVLQAHGVLQTGIATNEQICADFQTLKQADIAKHGLHNCALPSCSKTEKTAKEFAVCTGCRSVVYCCLEHQALDWDAHTQACTDIAKHGLRDCALPFCSRTEKTVKEFAGCSGCRSVVYCCLEHQALDWRAHKIACREKEVAQLASEKEADIEAGAGAAAA